MKWLNKFNLPLPLAEAIMEDLYYGKRESALQEYLKKHGLKPEEIVHMAVYLASDEAAWVTGSSLVVDGGLTSGIWSS